MTLTELKAKLEADGWRMYPPISSLSRGCNWYAAYTLDSAKHCACNEKSVQLVCTPSHIEHSGRVYESCEIDLTAADPGHDWWKLCAYSLTPQEVAYNWRTIGQRLQRAWEAL